MVKRCGPLALPHAGREGGNTRRIHGRQEGGLCLLSGVFFPPTETVKTHAVPGNQLNYIKMLQVVSRPELEPREVLSPAALHELRQLRLCQQDPLGAARALDAGRTRSPALAWWSRWRRDKTSQAISCLPLWFVPASANGSLPKPSTERPTCSCWDFSLIDSIRDFP
jgi:hypothetical protein